LFIALFKVVLLSLHKTIKTTLLRLLLSYP